MQPTIIDTIDKPYAGGTVKIGHHPHWGPCCVPAAHYYIELPSGMRHFFTSLRAAIDSQYWPATSARGHNDETTN